jgi:PAS domain S-box-containing protein
MAAKFKYSELLVDESPDALIAMTSEGRAMYWSKGAETMLGHTRIEAAPTPLECLIAPEIWGKK